jgi:hypothetical protein
VRRRLFVALLGAGLLLVAGFTAASVASGGSPFSLLADQPRAAGDTTTDRDTLDRTTTEQATSAQSTEDESSEDESAKDEKAEEKTRTDESKSNQKVTICHHTGSKKHPFHPITVNEHALAAHTGHGDTVGRCPAITAPAAKHGKPKHSGGRAKGAGRSDRSEQGRENRNDGQSQRPKKHAGGPSN